MSSPKESFDTKNIKDLAAAKQDLTNKTTLESYLKNADGHGISIYEDKIREIFSTLMEMEADHPEMLSWFLNEAFSKGISSDLFFDLLTEALDDRSIRVMGMLIHRMPKTIKKSPQAIRTFDALIRYYARSLKDIKEQDPNLVGTHKKEIENEIENLSKIILPYCPKENDESCPLFITSIVQQGNLRFLMQALRVYDPNQDLDRGEEILFDCFSASLRYNQPEIKQYLISHYLSKQDIVDFVSGFFRTASLEEKIALFREWLPILSQDTVRDLWRGMAITRYRPFLDRKMSLELSFVTFKERFDDEGENKVLSCLKLLNSVFQPNIQDLNEALEVALLISNYSLFLYLASSIKINQEDIPSLNFADKYYPDKHDHDAWINLLNHLRAPNGAWSLFVPIMKRLMAVRQSYYHSFVSEEKFSSHEDPVENPDVEKYSFKEENVEDPFLKTYFEKHYFDKAPLLAALPKIMDEDNVMALKKLINEGLDINAYLLTVNAKTRVYHVNAKARVYHFVTPIMLALKKKRYQCLAFLLQSGIVLYDKGLGQDNEVTFDDIRDMDSRCLSHMLDNNHELKSFWRCAKSSVVRSEGENEKSSKQIADQFYKFNVEDHAIYTQDNCLRYFGLFIMHYQNLLGAEDYQTLAKDFFDRSTILAGKKLANYLILPAYEKEDLFSKILDLFIASHIDESLGNDCRDFICQLLPPRVPSALLELYLKIIQALMPTIDLKKMNAAGKLDYLTFLRLLSKNGLSNILPQNSIVAKGILWLDAIRFMDLNRMKSLIASSNLQGVNHKLDLDSEDFECLALPHVKNIPYEGIGSTCKIEEEVTPFILFIYASYSLENPSKELLSKIVKIFKWMLEKGADFQMRKEMLGPMKDPKTKDFFSFSLDNCSNRNLKNMFKLILNLNPSYEQNWAGLALMHSFLKSNKDSPIKNCILNENKDGIEGQVFTFLGYTGYKLKGRLCPQNPQKSGKKGLLDSRYSKSLQGQAAPQEPPLPGKK